MNGVSTTIVQNRWFGFYNPALPLPIVSDADRQGVFNALTTPLGGPEDAWKFFEATKGLPTLRRIGEEVKRNGVSLLFSDKIPSALFSKKDDTGNIVFPTGAQPISYLGSLVHAAGSVMDFPEGVEIPAVRPLTDVENAKRLLWTRYRWRAVVFESLIFQLAVEMKSAGFLFSGMPMNLGFLDAVDLELFRNMRRGGLYAMARSYLGLMNGDAKSFMENSIERSAEALVQSGAGTFYWNPPEAGPRPDVPKTFIDDALDAMEPYRLGLYSLEGELAQLPVQRIKSILTGLKDGVETRGDLDDVLDLIRELAPSLAERILSKDVLDRVDLDVVSGNRGNAVVATVGDSRMILTGGCSPDERVRINIQSGAEKLKVIVCLLPHLASFSIPLPYMQLGSDSKVDPTDVDSLSGFYKRKYIQRDMWGHTAVFEFCRESMQRGIEFKLDNVRRTMMDKIEARGLFALCAKWKSLVPPDLVRLIDAQIRQVAGTIVARNRWKGAAVHVSDPD